MNATVLGASHLLYAHVHHHYGLNDAFDRSVAILLSRLAPAGNGSPDDTTKQLGGRPAAEQGSGGDATERTASSVQSAAGRRHLLGAPAVLRQRLLLAAQDAEASMQQQVPQQGRGRQLGELPVVKHPCLHDGYSQQYKRLHLDGAAMPEPPQVVLMGR